MVTDWLHIDLASAMSAYALDVAACPRQLPLGSNRGGGAMTLVVLFHPFFALSQQVILDLATDVSRCLH